MISSSSQKPLPLFRILALVLLCIVVSLIIAILQVPDLSSEVEKARKELISAQQENARLLRELELTQSTVYIETSARERFGYAYPGEIIYEPVLRTDG